MATIPTAGTTMADLFPRTLRALTEYGEVLRERYREELTKSGRPTMYNDALRSTAEVDVTAGDYTLRVSLLLQEYWKYVERGTRPHWPPRSPIEEWIKVKPIVPHGDGKRVPSVKSLEFLIARKISRVGTKGSHDLQKAVEGSRDVQERINEAVAADVAENIGELVKYLHLTA